MVKSELNRYRQLRTPLNLAQNRPSVPHMSQNQLPLHYHRYSRSTAGVNTVQTSLFLYQIGQQAVLSLLKDEKQSVGRVLQEGYSGSHGLGHG